MDYLYEYISEKLLKFAVVPHAGTWIEISETTAHVNFDYVVPHAGTWIEIPDEFEIAKADNVVPHAGTWIEIEHDAGH